MLHTPAHSENLSSSLDRVAQFLNFVTVLAAGHFQNQLIRHMHAKLVAINMITYHFTWLVRLEKKCRRKHQVMSSSTTSSWSLFDWYSSLLTCCTWRLRTKICVIMNQNSARLKSHWGWTGRRGGEGMYIRHLINVWSWYPVYCKFQFLKPTILDSIYRKM